MKIDWKFAGELFLEMILHFVKWAFIGFSLASGVVLANWLCKYWGF